MQSPLKQKLQTGQPVSGLIIQSPTPALVEIAGYVGFDFVFLDAEHSPLSERDCEDLVRAAEVAGTVPLVRVPSVESGLVLRFLDTGAKGIIIPGAESRWDVEAAVRAAKYAPEGMRGLSAVRAARYGQRGPLAEYVKTANEDIAILAIVESPKAMEDLEEMMATPGLDGIVVGATDLSQAMGLPGQQTHPKVKEACDEIFRRARAAGTPSGAVVRPGENIAEYRAKGVQILLTGAFGLLAGAARRFAAEVAGKQ